MPDPGKIDAAFFEEHVRPHLGAQRADVRLGPTPGVDFGLIEVGGRALVLATDPISILPELGFERAARFALDVVLADVAVSGLPPTHLAVDFTLPPETTDAELATLWRAIDAEAAALGTSIVTGHTARYHGCSYPWIGGATALAVGDFGEVVRPDGARPGDRIVVTTGPGVETVGLLATLFGDRMGLPDELIETASERLAEARTVRDALAAAAAGPVSAMHDATEGGLDGALCEMAASAGVRLAIGRETVPTRPGVAEVCASHDLDPWRVSSAGTLVVTVPPEGVDGVLAALESRGTAAAVVGTVERGSGAYVDGERIEPPETDSSWAVYAAYTERATESEE